MSSLLGVPGPKTSVYRETQRVYSCHFLSFSATKVYKKVGDDVVLRPDALPDTSPLTSILWKHGDDIAIEWDTEGVEVYRQFECMDSNRGVVKDHLAC